MPSITSCIHTGPASLVQCLHDNLPERIFSYFLLKTYCWIQLNPFIWLLFKKATPLLQVSKMTCVPLYHPCSNTWFKSIKDQSLALLQIEVQVARMTKKKEKKDHLSLSSRGHISGKKNTVGLLILHTTI